MLWYNNVVSENAITKKEDITNGSTIYLTFGRIETGGLSHGKRVACGSDLPVAIIVAIIAVSIIYCSW